jgi:hypothetical protein
MTTRTDKEHLFRFSQRNETTHAFAGATKAGPVVVMGAGPPKGHSGLVLK